LADKVAVGYCRVSGQSQLSGDGFPRQHDSILSWSNGNGWAVKRFYDEQAVPGKLGEEARPAFQAMIADLLGNGCRTIVIESMDRLARQYDIQQQLATYIASKGLRLISANTGEDITAALMGDPMRRALVQIQGIFGELDKNMLVNKLRKARERKKAATGKCEGRKRYGSTPDERSILNVMRSMHFHGMGYAEIAENLNDEGKPTRYGGKWHAGTVSKILRREHAQEQDQCPTCGSPERDNCVGFCPDDWHGSGPVTNGVLVPKEAR
jgi:DNA invertase Pin-like site-specific DNA recombinase